MPALGLLLLCGARSADAKPLLVRDAQIVDPAARRVSRGSVVIREGRIAEVLDEAPASFEGHVIAAEGKWLMPGLNDMHTHSYGNMAPSPAGPGVLREPFGTEVTARLMLYAGATGFLDLFAPEEPFFALRDRQRESGLVGADIYGSGPCFTAPDGHCTEYGVPTRVIDTPEDARRELRELARRRPDVVKLIYDHGPGGRPTVNRETMQALLAAAREHGLKTVVHIGTWRDAEEVVRAGATSLTHIAPGELPDDLARLMRERGVALSATLAVYSDLVSFSDQPELLESPLLRAVASPEAIGAYLSAGERDWVAQLHARQRSTKQARQRNLRKLAAAGVPLLAGTDSGNVGTFQAFSLHRELELMVEAGLTPWQVLAAATIEPGRLLGRSFGVRVGDEANLLLLDASPLDDIRNTRAISTVIHHGVVVDREALLEAGG